MNETRVWGIHAGEDDEVHALFMNGQTLAIGSATYEIGDLRRYVDQRDLRRALLVAYPKMAGNSALSHASALDAFVNLMSVGDYVVYSPRAAKLATRVIHVGLVTGEYEYRPEGATQLPY